MRPRAPRAIPSPTRTRLSSIEQATPLRSLPLYSSKINHPLTCADRFRPMGKHDAGHTKFRDILGYHPLVIEIKIACGFVHNENYRSATECPGDQDTLPLPTGKRNVIVGDRSVILHRQLHNLVMDIRHPSRPYHILAGKTLAEKGNILLDRCIDQVIIL